MNDDQRLRDALAAADHEPRPAFRAELRQQLVDEWHGRHVLPTVHRPAQRSWWVPLSAAAVVTALLVGGLVWIAQRGDAPDGAPAATVPAITAGSTAPVTTTAEAAMPGGTAPPLPTAPEGGVDGPVMFAGPGDGDRMDAVVAGTLDLEGECLLVVSADARYPILWPYGTRWDADAGAVETPGGTRIRLLDTFAAGGGFAADVGAVAGDPAVLDRAAHCREVAGATDVAIVQGEPSVTVTDTPQACFPGMSPDEAFDPIVETMLGAREIGSASIAGGCYTWPDDAFTGTAPHCWEPCGERSVARDHIGWGEVVEPDGSTWWSLAVPVSYRTSGGFTDVVESWEARPVDGEWRIELVSIDPALPDRSESLDAINAYLAALGGGDWGTAADVLMQGGASPEDRDDIRRLAPESFDREGIAAALAAWCASGCDTAAVTDDELVFTGGYAAVRGGETLQATWFEGAYGVAGVPWRRQQFDPAGVLRGWPSPPAPDGAALERLPYLVPGLAAGDLGGLTAIRSDWVIDGVGPSPRYHQIWFDTERATMVRVETVLHSSATAPEASRTPVDIDGWDAAFLSDTVDPVVNVHLSLPAATVTVQGVGLSEHEVIEVARSLGARAPDRAGWQVGLPGSAWVSFGEGWDSDRAARGLAWRRDDGTLVGQLEIGYGSVDRALTDQHWADTRTFTEVDGAFAVVTDTRGRIAVTWQPAPDVTALFGWIGPADEALAIARSLRRVDRATWEAYAEPDPMTDDGCNSLFC